MSRPCKWAVGRAAPAVEADQVADLAAGPVVAPVPAVDRVVPLRKKRSSRNERDSERVRHRGQ